MSVFFTLPATAADLSLRLLPEIHHANSGSPFQSPDSDVALLRTEALLNWQRSGWTLAGALSAERDSHANTHSDAYLNELFYETGLGSWELSVGQKRLGWGTGYGFRPLDTIQREPRRSVQPLLLDGVPSLILEKFTDTASLSLIYAAKTAWDDWRAENITHSGTARWYRFSGDWEWLGLGAWAEDTGLTLGGGFSVVHGDNWKFHGELAWQQDYETWRSHLLDNGELFYSGDPMYQEQDHNAWQAVLGAQWTHAEGAGVLVEYWYDGSAWQGGDWQDLTALARRQRAALATPDLPDAALAANLGAAAQAYLTANQLRHNLLLRLSHDSGERTVALEWLTTPEDGGSMLTLLWEDQTLNRHQIRLGARLYSGPGDSAYGALDKSLQVFATWETGWKL